MSRRSDSGHEGGHSHGGHSHGGHSHGDERRKQSGHAHGVSVERGFVPGDGSLVRSRQELRRGAGEGKLLYLDCSSGIAGDMTIAALLDLGVPRTVLDEAVGGLQLEGVRLEIKQGYAGAIGCTHFDVLVDSSHEERSYRDIKHLLDGADLADDARQLAHAIFARLAHAEAEVHRTSVDDVHFHEVGAVDAVVDVVGAAAGFSFLGARVQASPVPLGRGFVDCRHGVLPLPAPAALGCLRGVPTVPSGLDVELVTPTGAAILATVSEEYSQWCRITPDVVGWGAGTRGLPDRPNVLRAVLGDSFPNPSEALTHALLEANVDDMTGELLAHVIDLTLQRGALDAWAAPATMKKGRPGIVLGVLVERHRSAEMADLLHRETTSIGVRQTLVSRYELPRRIEVVETRFGRVRVKVSGENGETIKPELDDCRAIALREGIALKSVLREVEADALRLRAQGRTSD